ncbi:MAG: hydrogenase nickel incorporation protein HypB [Dehalococcoidia bacterium]|nr:hydrogenase nickel incorporation protein HypB [Dehalococcoidia bacterium]
MKIKVLRDILSANDEIAAGNKQMLDSYGVLAIDVMSSPGAGKTSLILRTIEKLKDMAKIAVIEGDIASSIDADKINKVGTPAIQINTGGACHLDANMLRNGLRNINLADIDLLFVENVGNLVCPAELQIGTQKRMMLLSVPEGDDKPSKYPLMFTQVEAIVVNKIDLLPYSDFDFDNFHRTVSGLNPSVRIFKASCKTGDGIEEWISWLKSELGK